MEREKAELYARLSLHEGLLEQLWSLLMMSDPDPAAAASRTMKRAMELARRDWPTPGAGAADAAAVSMALHAQTQRFWLKVQARVEEEMDKRAP